MTPAATWHPGEEVLQDYVDGGLPGLSAASVEAHLLGCAGCRDLLRGGVAVDRLARLRDSLDDRLDLVERPRLERLVVRLGVGESDARALLAAPNLRRAWWLAVLAAAGLGLLVAGDAQHPDAVFLVLAPLVPLATTAVAYAPALDPAFAIVAATPYRTLRLLLARSLAVGVTSLVGVGLAALALPTHDVTAVLWLLPAAALTLGVLALAPRLGTGVAAGSVGGSWLLLVGTLERQGHDITWVKEAATQGISAVITAAALAAIMHQWARLDGGGRA
jgi:hypothetical protein